MRIKTYINGKSIRIILEKRNKTIKWLSETAQVSYVHLRLAMTGQRSIGGDARKRIAKALNGRGVKWDDMFRYDFYTMGSDAV